MDIQPKTPWKERRNKDGSIEDRKLTADCIRIGRASDSRLRANEKKMEYNAFMLAGCILLAMLILVIFGSKAHAYTDQEAIQTIVGEASNQGLIGMTAVAEVIRHKHTLRGFYGFKAMNDRHEPKWMWEMAGKAWEASKTSNLTHDANHFENIHAFGKPYWVKSCVKTFEYKDHIFYLEHPRKV